MEIPFTQPPAKDFCSTSLHSHSLNPIIPCIYSILESSTVNCITSEYIRVQTKTTTQHLDLGAGMTQLHPMCLFYLKHWIRLKYYSAQEKQVN